jgi:hypothetical protein
LLESWFWFWQWFWFWFVLIYYFVYLVLRAGFLIALQFIHISADVIL